MVALAQSVTLDGTTYDAGTDHTALPAGVADRIRNPVAWVGGTAPALSLVPFGKARLKPADLSSADKARTALGLSTREQRWAPAGAITVNANRADAGLINNTGVLTSGRLQLAGGLVIPAGATVSAISFVSGTQAAETPTNQWFCLVDVNLNVLAKTADATNAAWAANTVKTLTLATPYTAPREMPVYAGLMVAAGTVPDLRGVTSATATTAIVPILAASSTTGLTTPASLGATAGALTAVGVLPFAYLT